MTRKRTIGASLAIAGLVIAGTTVASQSASAAAFVYDSYTHASVIPLDDNFIGLNNTDATTQTGEITTFSEPSPYNIFQTVWAKWTAPASGWIEVDNNASNVTNTSLAIYSSATSLSKAKRLAYNNDSVRMGTHTWAQIDAFAIKKGTTYYFQTGSVGVDSNPDVGTIYVNINPSYSAPANDQLTAAVSESGSHWVGTSTTFGATLEPGWEPNSDRAASVWWKWKPTASGTFSVDTVGSAVGDPFLAIYQRSPEGNFTQVSIDLGTGPGGQAAIANQSIVENSTYYIASGQTGGSHQGTIKVNLTSNLAGPTITKITPASGSFHGGTTVTIMGTKFNTPGDEVNEVSFGSVSNTGSNLHIISATKLTVVVPASFAKKKVWVQLSGPHFISYINTASHFTYK